MDEQAITETPQNKAITEQKRAPWLFGSERARELQRLSLEKRRQNKAKLLEDKAKLEANAATAQTIIDSAVANAIVQTIPTDSYRLTRLARVRTQLDAVDSEIEKAVKRHKPDQSRLKSLIEAQSRLSEQERKLDNRPDPGSRRPSRVPATKRTGEVGPVE